MNELVYNRDIELSVEGEGAEDFLIFKNEWFPSSVWTAAEEAATDKEADAIQK